MTLDVPITADDITLGERAGLDRTPLALALARALNAPTVSVFQGPSLTPVFDVRALAPVEDGTRWHLAGVHVGRDGYDVPLPRAAQIFCSVWKYGPCGGQPFAIRNTKGEVIARRPYAEIIKPFSFTLEF